jgi:hypothetical protein
MAANDLERALARIDRRQRRERRAHDIANVTAAQKAGLPVSSAVIGGTLMTLAAPQATPPQPAATPQSTNPWDEIYGATH